MDRETLILLDEMFERAATRVTTKGFASESIRLTNPTREQVQRAGEMLLERVAEQHPELDAHISSSTDGTITLVLERLRQH